MQSHYLQFDVRISFRVGLTKCHSSNVARRRGEFAIDAKKVQTFLHLLFEVHYACMLSAHAR